jgi:hypothetical protein
LGYGAQTPIPNPQSPIPNPQSPINKNIENSYNNKKNININILIYFIINSEQINKK